MKIKNLLRAPSKYWNQFSDVLAGRTKKGIKLTGNDDALDSFLKSIRDEPKDDDALKRKIHILPCNKYTMLDLSNTVVYGDTDICGIFTKVSFKNTRFKGKVTMFFSGIRELDCTDCVFEDDVDMSISLIKQARFTGAVFKKRAEFRGVVWGTTEVKDTFFNDVTAYDSVVFTESVFQRARFTGMRAFGNVGFRGVLFKNDAFFSRVRIDGIADFKSATFAQDVDMRNAVFGGKADFSSPKDPTLSDISGRYSKSEKYTAIEAMKDGRLRAHVIDTIGKKPQKNESKTVFQSDAFFDHTFFYHDASFSGTRFEKQVSFEGTVFDGRNSPYGCAYFENAVFCGTANFTNAVFWEVGEFVGSCFHGNVFLNQIVVGPEAMLVFRGGCRVCKKEEKDETPKSESEDKHAEECTFPMFRHAVSMHFLRSMMSGKVVFSHVNLYEIIPHDLRHLEVTARRKPLFKHIPFSWLYRMMPYGTQTEVCTIICSMILLWLTVEYYDRFTMASMVIITVAQSALLYFAIATTQYKYQK